MPSDTECEAYNWRPPAPLPTTSPRTLAMVLLGVGLLICAVYMAYTRMASANQHVSPFGCLIVLIWLVRSLNLGLSFAVTGWWISIVWHALLLLLSIVLLPFALVLASNASWIFLLPHLWLVAAFFLSIAGLRAERQLRRASIDAA